MAGEMITTDGEILPVSTVPQLDVGAAVAISRAEIDMQIATARKFTRSVSVAVRKMIESATLNEEIAARCFYSLKRSSKGKRHGDDEAKAIEGPSVGLARIAAQAWGNCRIDARVTVVNRREMWLEAEAVFHDLESNYATRAVARRGIRTSGGYVFSEDMIMVTGMAACAIAKRNAIIDGIGAPILIAYQAARACAGGTLQTLEVNRKKLYGAFAGMSVTPAMIHDFLEVGGEADVNLDHIARLRAKFAEIRDGEATVASVFVKPAMEPVRDALGPGEKTKPEASGEGGGAGRRDYAAGHQPAVSTVTASPSEIVVPPGAENAPQPPPGDATMQEDAGGPAGPLASSQDQPEPAASEAAQEAVSEPASLPDAAAGQDDDRPPPEPTDDASYQAHVFWWGTREADYEAAKARWAKERTMRNKLQISSEVVDRCKDFLSKTWEG